MDLFEPSFDASPYAFGGDALREIAFPLGGLGTGCVSLDGRGALVDWEIFGSPNKGCVFDFTFPCLWVQADGEDPQASVLLGPRRKGFVGSSSEFWAYGHGRFFEQMDGLPHAHDNAFTGTFPLARVSFLQPRSPVTVELAAWSPFVPGDEDASGYPCACLTYRVTNRSASRVRGSLAWSVINPVGSNCPLPPGQAERSVAEEVPGGIRFGSQRLTPEEQGSGTFALLTDWPNTSACARWRPEGWWDGVRRFWNSFRRDGSLTPSDPNEGDRMPGTLALHFDLAPGESADLPFVFAWHFPNPDATWKPFIATRFSDAEAAAREFIAKRAELERRTLTFERALHDSTLPAAVLQSVGATLTTLRTPTLIRLADGNYWAWEGCSAKAGCCEGTCSHVWNYALAHAFLFPGIQRSFLDTHFQHGFGCGPAGAEGAMNFRLKLPLGTENPLWHAASDGQLGMIVQLYRDWRLTGDTDWLRQRWPEAKLAMRYAAIQWDRDGDGLVEGDMHNTYDINFCTPNPLSQFFYLAALRGCSAMADALGEDALPYRTLAEAGQRLTEQRLWTGEFFRQEGNFEAEDAPRYQHGAGCLSDQVFGQLASTIAGLGDLVDPALVQSSLEAIYRHNFRAPLGQHENLQRMYAYADESGLLLCSWPDGEQPAYPFVYSDEVWTGIEYQVATHLAFAGRKDLALTMVTAIRQRYDGTRRNPFNEFECGSHYARALASFGLLLAWTGVRVDRIDGQATLGTEPFRGLFAVPGAWGIAQRYPDGQAHWEVIEGSLPGITP